MINRVGPSVNPCPYCGKPHKEKRKRKPLDPKWLRFITSFQAAHGYPPTIREIQEGLGISSTSVVDYWLHRLWHNGAISYQPGKARTIRVLDTQPASE